MKKTLLGIASAAILLAGCTADQICQTRVMWQNSRHYNYDNNNQQTNNTNVFQQYVEYSLNLATNNYGSIVSPNKFNKFDLFIDSSFNLTNQTNFIWKGK